MSGYDKDYKSGEYGSYHRHTEGYGTYAGYSLGEFPAGKWPSPDAEQGVRERPRRLGGWALLETMAAHAFVFVILASIGGALLATASLSLPRVITGGAQMLGAGLQIFAAVWFIALVVIAWRRFTQTDWNTASPTPRAVEDVGLTPLP